MKRARAAATPTKRATAKPKASRDPAAAADFGATFVALRAILEEHAPRLVVAVDGDMGYSLNTRATAPGGKSPMFFGAVQRRKSYVSFYLMPVYVYPDLLKGASPALRARMQGKSCFNFRAPDHTLFDELRALARQGYRKFREARLA